MQFSTTLNQPIVEKTWWERFSSQPHQMFFAAAIFFALFIMILTILTLTGAIQYDFSLIHGFGLNYALFTNAFLGFLITVMPKYNSSSIITKDKYIPAWMIYQIGIITTIFISAFIGKILICLTLFYFVKIFYETIKKGQATIKDDSIYINSILALGGILLFIEAISFYNLSSLIFFAYLLSMVFIIAIRMIPAFFFAFTRVTSWQKPKYVKPISFLILALTGIAMQFHWNLTLTVVSLFGSLFFGFILYKLNLFQKKLPAMISILVVGLIWFEIGYISVFLESIFIDYSFKLSLHIFALGFVTTLLIGFGSRVCLGHAVPPLPMVADKLTKFIFFLTQIVLILRVLTSLGFVLKGEIFAMFLHLSSTLWILLFLLWLFRYGTILLRIKA